MSRQFADDPREFFARSRMAMHTLPPDELARLQLAGARLRFAEQYDALPVLRAMADEQGIDELRDLDAAAPLLFPHTVYKSYPASLLLDGRFDLLTRWLSRLTTVDLSGLDTSRCDSIDAWLDLLDTQTEVRLAHSSGTSGSMSFVPHTAEQYRKLYEIVRLDVLPDSAWNDERIDVVWPGYRLGRSGIDRHAAAMAEQIAGSPARFHSLHSGLLSADVMFLAGRMRAAAARGELDRLEIPETLLARRDEFAEAQRPDAMGEFAERLGDTLRGSRVASLSLWSTYFDLASTGAERGLEQLFAADSVVFPGGGAKGTSLPDAWARPVERFFGVPRLRYCYAMTEVIALNLLCDHDGYHIEPWVVLYVLDPDTGAPLPRDGVRTGRAAFLDLTADVQWGGFVSGDRVTADWTACACGRTTPRLTMDIGRFTGPGGDDKITCAATPEALDEALGLLNGSLA
ncbi:hypothetical protein OIE66_42470 [Nonomuraea sp. NBC_01738]|uniref:hypothetical protein n=1 Tax=Nonomuraea sp. NBC_01738 TaxID=2976003 RepID=UPI002E13D068|nr:hypothetical protein OIE66_42470 [Nonomuraea sp. NBC_01738]